jgi:hypothetical protein
MQNNKLMKRRIIMALINCPKCGKQLPSSTKFCPDCDYQLLPVTASVFPQANKASTKRKISALSVFSLIFSILGCTFLIGLVLAIIDLRKKDDHKKGVSIAALIICGIWFVLVGTNNTISKDTSDNSAVFSTEENTISTDITLSDTTNSDVEETTPTENNELQESNPYKEAFERGFNDHFSISDENKENLDSIKNSADEIRNDDEVQEAYEEYKESLKNSLENKKLPQYYQHWSRLKIYLSYDIYFEPLGVVELI